MLVRVRQMGLSLVELMISLAMGALLTLGVAGLIVNAQRAYWHDEQLAEMRDNGRYAMTLLRRELSMAGFTGFVMPAQIAVHRETADPCFAVLLTPAPAIEHYDDLDNDGLSGAGIDLPSACRRRNYYQAGSDALLLRRVLDSPLRLRGATLAAASETATYLATEGDAGVLQRGPGSAANLWRYAPRLWFVRSYSLSPADKLPGLCRIRLSPHRASVAPVECLVEGVERLQVEFGLDTDGDLEIDQYTAAPPSGALPQALLVNIYLLIRSRLPLAQLPRARDYPLGSSLHRAGADGYLRQVMTTSVVLRNSDALRS